MDAGKSYKVKSKLGDIRLALFFWKMIQLGAKLLKENTKATDKSYTEKTIDVPCVQVDGTWYVKEFSDDLVDVVSSNLYSVAKELKEK